MDHILCSVIVRFHDEYHKGGKKGEGMLLMDYVIFRSAEYSWMRSPDGKHCAHKRFKEGENQDGSPMHKKQGPEAPSAHQMPRFMPKPTRKDFLVSTIDQDTNEVEVAMTGVYFSKGQPQSLSGQTVTLASGCSKAQPQSCGNKNGRMLQRLGQNTLHNATLDVLIDAYATSYSTSQIFQTWY
ncbi:hypothetical protein BDV93DRAFT_507923 [Ceratobasidium sp. AG-I]|nr:hypothetical protein BDV93DRAFT_507923 [Ceratobasidium sp. AG-I]